MKTWLCIICGLIYDEAKGWPDDGIAPGTRWEDVPEDWLCPECKVGKADFEMIELSTPIAAVATAPVIQAQPLVAARPAQPVVIIGSGHAGYGLAQALRKAAPQLEIRVLTQESGHLYSKPALSIALAQGRTAAALATETPLAIEQRLGIRIYTGCKVERIDAQAQRLYTSLGEMDYGQLVLASGASPVRLPIEGRAEALLSVNNLQDYQAFRQRLGEQWLSGSGNRPGCLAHGTPAARGGRPALAASAIGVGGAMEPAHHLAVHRAGRRRLPTDPCRRSGRRCRPGAQCSGLAPQP